MNYSIDTIARLTGISAFTLRNWEKRYDFLKPERLENGFRAYGESHVEMLRKVSSLLRHGAKIGDLAENIRKGKALPEIQLPELVPEVQAQAQQLYSALLNYDIDQAETVHAEMAARFSAQQMLDLLYQPLLSRVGKDWTLGEATAAQEHFASAFVRLKLAPYLTLFNSTHSSGSKRKVICATTTGETHEGGLMLITAHLRINGWMTYYFGANLPVEQIQAAAQSIRPDLICLSFSDTQALKSAIPQLTTIQSQICIGGFAALTYDGDERLPAHIHLIKNSGREAMHIMETL